MRDLSAYHLSYLRIIHLAPGLDFRMYAIPRSVVAKLTNLTNRDLSELELTEEGLKELEERNLRRFGRPHNDQHELELRDRLAALKIPQR